VDRHSAAANRHFIATNSGGNRAYWPYGSRNTEQCTHTSHPETDLADVFPEAGPLFCNLNESMDGASPRPIEHASLALDCLSASSPRLVSKLRLLKVNVFHQEHIQTIGVSLTDLLS
jgi:hypothetical protein